MSGNSTWQAAAQEVEGAAQVTNAAGPTIRTQTKRAEKITKITTQSTVVLILAVLVVESAKKRVKETNRRCGTCRSSRRVSSTQREDQLTTSRISNRINLNMSRSKRMQVAETMINSSSGGREASLSNSRRPPLRPHTIRKRKIKAVVATTLSRSKSSNLRICLRQMRLQQPPLPHHNHKVAEIKQTKIVSSKFFDLTRQSHNELDTTLN